MKIVIAGRGIELTASIKETIETKLKKIEKYFTPDTIANVTLKTQKNNHIVEITIPVKGNVIRVEHETDDMYKTIDEGIETVEKQILKYRTKIKDKKLHDIVNNNIGDFSDNGLDDENNDEIKIVKKKHFLLKPMTPVEACMQSELVNHDFFLFTNAETNTVCAVYKRKDGAYGLIEPEME